LDLVYRTYITHASPLASVNLRGESDHHCWMTKTVPMAAHAYRTTGDRWDLAQSQRSP